jgi:Ca-activated chloride channel family protein
VTFAAPSLLFLLAAVPLAAVVYFRLERARRMRATLWSQAGMLPNLVRDPLRRWRFAPTLLFAIGLSFLLVGVAQPERVLPSSVVENPTVVLAFDLSSSMGAHDVSPNRLAVARSIARAFVRKLPAKYRVAVVTFGNTPVELVPPTIDRGEVISDLPSTVLTRSGTAIGDGVNQAVAIAAGISGAQASTSDRPGAVLLFSDGGQNAGGTTPEEAAISALVDYVPVDTVAIGTSHGTVTQLDRVSGFPTPIVIPVPVDSDTLRTLSKQTDGRFFEATAVERSPSALDAVYRGLQSYALPTHALDDLSAFSAGVGIVFAAIGAILSGLLYGRIV